MAYLGMDPVHATKFHVTNMLQRSHLLTSEDTPPTTPHLVSRPINYYIRAEGSQIGDNMAIDQSNPDHTLIVADQLWTLADHQLVDKRSRTLEIFDLLGNVCPELLVESSGAGLVVGSGELSPESSNNSLDHGETFAFGNDGLD